MTDRWSGIDLVWLLGAVVLVGAAVLNRGVPGRTMLVMALVWAGIIAAVALVAHLLGLA